MTRLLILALLTGCSANKGSALDTDFSAGVGDTSSTPESDMGDGDTAIDAPETAWWRLSAEVEIADGQPVAASSQLAITLLTDALKPQCTEQLTLAKVAEASSPHSDVYVWWQLTTGKGDGGCAGYDLPQADVLLGVGAMHPDILPGLKSRGAAPDASALNGAYASLDDEETLVVFGAAGLLETWSDGGAPVKAAPLTDGTWRIEPVYTFEYTR